MKKWFVIFLILWIQESWKISVQIYVPTVAGSRIHLQLKMQNKMEKLIDCALTEIVIRNNKLKLKLLPTNYKTKKKTLNNFKKSKQ